MPEAFKDRLQRNLGFVRFLVFTGALVAQVVLFSLLADLYRDLVIVVYFPPLGMLVLAVMACVSYFVARRVVRQQTATESKSG